jgi:putative transcriptional regulator
MRGRRRGGTTAAGRVRWAAALAATLGFCLAGCGGSESYQPISPAEARRLENLAAGRFLVASPDISDEAFARTVILILRYDARSTAGLIINRPSRLPVSQALKAIPNAAAGAGTVFYGGPVGRTAVLALLRSRSTPAGATRILRECHLISSAELLSKYLGAGAAPDTLRVFLGYAGWGAGQLEQEVEAGEWLIFPGETRLVFDPHPETLWSRLIGRLEQQLAKSSTPALFYTGSSEFGSDRSLLL